MQYQQLVMVLFGVCWGAPADDPIRVDLPVYNQPNDASSLQLAQPLEPENHPGDQSNKKSFIGNVVSQKFEAATSGLGSKSQALGGILGPFADPVRQREDALQEIEGWGSKTLSIKENVGNAVAGIFQPKPIVDTIREEEKYGNSGDKFETVGKAVVGGAAGVSNLINNVLEIPSNIFKTIAKAASEKLNNFGGKLIGLN